MIAGILLDGDSEPRDRLRAAELLLSRGYGTPPQGESLAPGLRERWQAALAALAPPALDAVPEQAALPPKPDAP